MVEEPNFEYEYDLAYQKSFAARLSFKIMTIAAMVFLVAVLLFFHFTEDSMSLPMTHQIVKYGMVVFFVGLASLFVFCTIAIYHMVKPLKQFAESAVNIAKGDLDTPLPEIHSQDELLQLRNSFEYMQQSLKHIYFLYLSSFGLTTTQTSPNIVSGRVVATTKCSSVPTNGYLK